MSGWVETGDGAITTGCGVAVTWALRLIGVMDIVAAGITADSTVGTMPGIMADMAAGRALN